MDNQSSHPISSNEWMVVYIASSEPEAYIVAGRLQSEGIRTFVQQESVGRTYGFSVGPLGEVKVLVNPEDYDQAQAILDDDQYESDDTDPALENDDE